MFPDTPLFMVEDADALDALVERLADCKVLAVDTESDSMYHYQEKVCLLQLSDAHGDIVVDPLSIDDLSPLQPIFADPTVVKVFHGADYDVVSLKRDFAFQTTNIFDTLIAAQFLALDKLGLADLIETWFGIPIDKKFQRHDWSRRPLLTEHIDYARGDTHWLRALREILLRYLAKAGRVEAHEEECALVERRKWAGRTFDPDGWMRIKGVAKLDDDARRVVRRLYRYRDTQARKLDRPPYKVIGDKVLLTLATAQPESERELDATLPRMRGLKRRHASNLIAEIDAAFEDDEPLPDETPPKKPTKPPSDDIDGGPPVRLRGRAAERMYGLLKDWRNTLVQTTDYSTFTVASNSTLKRIARRVPKDLDELASVPEVRRWQVAEHGEAILALLAKHAPAETGNAKRKRRKS